MDGVRKAGDNAIFVWTLEGTHSETGNFVKVGGWEEWMLSGDLLVRESLGRYDAVEYERQVAHGA
jgi:myo-inositol-hexaphosphate 3-phosphohydrolase